MRNQGRILRFHKAHPGRTAGSELRQRTCGFAVRALLAEHRLAGAGDEFRTFFHDGQIRGKVVVENFKARFFHGRVKLARGECAGGKSEVLADGDTHGGRDDSGDCDRPVPEPGKNVLDAVGRFIGRAERTVDQALAAAQAGVDIDAVRCAERALDRAGRAMAFAGVAALAVGRPNGNNAGDFALLIGLGSSIHFRFSFLLWIFSLRKEVMSFDMSLLTYAKESIAEGIRQGLFRYANANAFSAGTLGQEQE